MKKTCVHSCKGLCNALEVAEFRELETIKEYRRYAENCDYPDVRALLEELIGERERSVVLLRQKREILSMKFDTLDRINESFQ